MIQKAGLIKMKKLEYRFILSAEVLQAQQAGSPLVALESVVITHGLPRPQNLSLAKDMEAMVRTEGATPATIAMLDGMVHVGLSKERLTRLANEDNTRKISLRDFGIAAARHLSGGTTVAATTHIAEKAGIRVFATGGIGGVHRGSQFDVSADLTELGRARMIVVCAGAKAILDLPATLETLETLGVPVIGYQTEDFPAFYSRSSGLKVDASVDTPAEIGRIALAHWDHGFNTSILVVVPPPEEVAIPNEQIEGAIQEALHDAGERGIHGAATTPYLLSRVSQLSGGESLKTNLALLLNNAKVAAQIARSLSLKRKMDILL
jgi:pseudouridine-5'-phosphate glycosidase